MQWEEFNKQAVKVGLRRGQVEELRYYQLIDQLTPGFSKEDVDDLLRQARYRSLTPQPFSQPPQFGNPPYVIIYPQGYFPPPPVTEEDEYEEDEDDEAPIWVWPVAIFLMILAVTAILVYLNPSLIPPVIQHLIQLGG